jgi:hypothetical protein
MSLTIATVVALGSPAEADVETEIVGDVVVEIRELSLQHKAELQNFVISDVPHGSRAFFVSELNRIGDKAREIAQLLNMDEEEISTEILEDLVVEIRQIEEGLFDRAQQLDHPDLFDIVSELEVMTNELSAALE